MCPVVLYNEDITIEISLIYINKISVREKDMILDGFCLHISIFQNNVNSML